MSSSSGWVSSRISGGLHISIYIAFLGGILGNLNFKSQPTALWRCWHSVLQRNCCSASRLPPTGGSSMNIEKEFAHGESSPVTVIIMGQLTPTSTPMDTVLSPMATSSSDWHQQQNSHSLGSFITTFISCYSSCIIFAFFLSLKSFLFWFPMFILQVRAWSGCANTSSAHGGLAINQASGGQQGSSVWPQPALLPSPPCLLPSSIHKAVILPCKNLQWLIASPWPPANNTLSYNQLINWKV